MPVEKSSSPPVPAAGARLSSRGCRPEGSCSVRRDTKQRGSLPTTSPACTRSHLTFVFGACSYAEAKAEDVRGQNRRATGDLEDAAPHRSSVPLGSGRFSAEQRGRAIKQQCQSTAQGSLPASVARIPNPVLQRQSLHDVVAALAAKLTLRSKRMNPFVRRDGAAATKKK